MISRIAISLLLFTIFLSSTRGLGGERAGDIVEDKEKNRKRQDDKLVSSIRMAVKKQLSILEIEKAVGVQAAYISTNRIDRAIVERLCLEPDEEYNRSLPKITEMPGFAI